MKYYYIDLENIGMFGFKGLECLTSNDKVFVFYSKNANTISIDILDKLIQTKCTIEYVHVPIGSNNAAKNAMDFYIITSVFSNIKNRNRECFIISKDRGFDYAIARGKNLGFKNIKRVETIELAINPNKKTTEQTEKQTKAKKLDIPKPNNNKKIKKKEKTLSEKGLEDILRKNLSSNEIKKYRRIISICIIKSNGPRAKNIFYNELVKQLGKNKGLKIYNQIKEDIDELL